MMDKRGMIKKALQDLVEPIFEREEFAGIDYDALAEQAIVIEAELKHQLGKMRQPETHIHATDVGIWVQGHLGTPGKALAIIISLEEQC